MLMMKFLVVSMRLLMSFFKVWNVREYISYIEKKYVILILYVTSLL
jgi:hypothetical protein